MGYLPQDINRPLAQRSAIVNTAGGLVASPFTGAVNTAVLLFAAAGIVSGPTSYIVEVNDAAAGTSVVLRKPGVYEVRLYLEITEPIDVRFGISQDVAAAGLNTEPSFATNGFLDVQRATTALLLSNSGPITTHILVRPEQSIAGTTIRFHATIVGGAAPANAFIAAGCYYTILRNNQEHS